MNLSSLCKGSPVEVERGLHTGMARERYDNIPAISASILKKWLSVEETPSEFPYWLREERWKQDPPEWFVLGLALDCLLLEWEHFSARFAVIPADAPKRPSRRLIEAKKPSSDTLAACAFWHAFNRDNAHKQILDATQYEAVINMRAALQGSPAVQDVFENCRKTVLVGELWNLPAKCEVDLWHPSIPHILDLKTAATVDPTYFADAACKFGYLEQASFYLLLAQALGFDFKTHFSFIVVRSSAPWTVQVRTFAPFDDEDHRTIFEGVCMRLERGARELVERLERNDFADPEVWNLLRFPEWYVRQNKMQTLLTYEAAR